MHKTSSSSSSEDISYPSYHYWSNINALQKKHQEEQQELNLQLLFASHYAINEENKNQVTDNAPKLMTQLQNRQKQERKQLRRKPNLKSSK